MIQQSDSGHCVEFPCPHHAVSDGRCAWHYAEKVLPAHVWLALSSHRQGWQQERADYVNEITATRLNVHRTELALVRTTRDVLGDLAAWGAVSSQVLTAAQEAMRAYDSAHHADVKAA